MHALAETQSHIAPFTAGDGDAKKAGEVAEQELQKVEGARKLLYELQAATALSGLPEVNCPLQHVFAPGACARSIFIPAGTVVVGKIHKHQHLNILSQGRVSMMTEGGGREDLQGPVVMVSQPGTKRALYAHTDVVWTVIHVTNETDIEKLEAEVIAPTYEDYEHFILEHKSWSGLQ